MYLFLLFIYVFIIPAHVHLPEPARLARRPVWTATPAQEEGGLKVAPTQWQSNRSFFPKFGHFESKREREREKGQRERGDGGGCTHVDTCIECERWNVDKGL